LHAVSELAEDRIGNVLGVLGDEIDANALGADQADDLFDFVQEGWRHVVEEQVGFVEEEHELGLGQVADLGEVFEEFGEHPEEERCVDAGGEHQFLGGEQVDDAVSLAVGLEEVVEVQGGFREETIAALLFEGHETALDGADAGGGDVSVAGGEGGGVFGDVGEQGSEVFQVQEEEAVFVGDLEDDVKDTGLGFVELEESGQEDRAHLGDGGAHRDGLGCRRHPRR
jgi:hypothetical protein